MEVTLLILLLGALTLSSTEAGCGTCGVKHPQQHYCDAKFVMKLTITGVVYNSELSASLKSYTAEIIRSWKAGPSSGEFLFYAPGFCGSSLQTGETYVVTGTKEQLDGQKYWMHGSCDYAIGWDDLEDQMKEGFKGEYAAQCAKCEIDVALVPVSVMVDDIPANDYSEASTYWTPSGCYYNPLMTQQYIGRKGSTIEECEDLYGLCKRSRGGKCYWEMTPQYARCFKERDEYVMVESGDFAITDISQCGVYNSNRKRRSCRKKFLQSQREQGADEDMILVL